MFDQLAQWWPQTQAAGVVIGALIVWLLSTMRSLQEAGRMRAELIGLKINQYEKLIALDEKQRQVIHTLNEQLHRTLEALDRHDAEAAKTARLETIDTFLLRYIGSFFQYAGVGRWVYLDNKTELIEDDLLPFLEISVDIKTALNRPDLLALTGQPPLRTEVYDFRFALGYVRRNTAWWRVNAHQHLERLGKALAG